MPAHATHMEILDKVITKIAQLNPELGQILDNNRDIAYLGCIAPDIYFLAPDISDEQRDVLYWLLDLYDKGIRPIIELYEKYIKPVEEGIEAVTGVIDDFLCNALKSLSEDGERLVSDAKTTLLTFLEVLAVKTINFFELFTPPIQKGESEDKWFWFDMLHYRSTSDYVLNIIRKLPGPDQPSSTYEIGLSYAMGHLSHIGADVTGHAFVNQIVGGPYRSHNRRHHIMENFMDVWTFNNYKNEELIGAKLHQKFAGGRLLDTLGTLRAVADGTLDLDPPDRLEKLIERLAVGFYDTYRDQPHPTRLENDFLTENDISMAYWLNLAMLKMSTDCILPPIESPADDLLEEINRQLDELRDAVGDFPEAPDAPDTCWAFWRDDCDFSWDAIKDFFEFIWESIKFLGKCLVWAFNVLKELLETLTCALIHTALLPVKAAVWIIRSLLTELYNSFRDALVVAGIALPTRDYVNSSPLGRQFTRTKGHAESFELYPHRQAESGLIGGLLFPEDTHLEYPSSPSEHPLTMNGPYEENEFPDSFIENTVMDHQILEDFSNAASPKETRTVERNALQNRKALGNAIDYSVKLILEAYDMWKEGTNLNIPNWNLDADRGYGYKCWTLKNPNSIDPKSKIEAIEDYIKPKTGKPTKAKHSKQLTATN